MSEARAKALVERQHSLLAPSAADRWTRCPGSVQLCKDIPETRTSEAAALGTAKHEASYWCLMHTFPNKTADGMQGQITGADGFAFTIDDEFVEHVNAYLKGVRAAVGKDDTAWYELELDTSAVLGVPEQSGTSDAVILRHSRRNLYIGDAKFGFNAVDVEDWRQGILYAGAALEKFDEFHAAFDTVTLAIHQPQVSDLPSERSYSANEIRDICAEYAAAAQEAVRPDATFHPGRLQCRWCPASPCKAQADAMLREFPIEMPAEVMLSPKITDAALAMALDRVDFIEACCRDIRAEALRRALAGGMPTHKIIEGRRGPRTWTDKMLATLQLEQDLGADAFKPREIVTPTEAEKRLKKAGKPYADVAWLVEQSPGAPSIVKLAEVGNPLPRQEFGLEEAQ